MEKSLFIGSAPRLLLHDDGELWTLADPLMVNFLSQGQEWFVQVPRDFVTDFASVPKFWRGVFGQTGPHQWSALIHDWLYACHAAGTHDLSREVVDRMFLDCMRAAGVGWRTRWPLYLIVRMAGEAYWDDHDGIQMDISYEHPLEVRHG